MPGSVGGGHSGGFSGGGSVGGGHSGSFGGHTGSFGTSHSNTNSTRSGGFSHIPYLRFGSGGGRRGGRSGGCSGLAILLLIVPILLIGAVITLGGNVVSYFSNGDNGYRYVENYEPVTEKLEGKTPLDAALCTPSDSWMDIRIGGYLSDADVNTIKQALQFFYSKTGVQPYFLLTSDIDGLQDPDEYEVSEFLTERYVTLFGEDEGHYILLMVLDADMGEYTTWYIPGLNAETVIDADGSDILLSYIDSNASAGASLAKAVSDALISTANDVIDGVVVTKYEDHGTFVYDKENKNFSQMFVSAAIILVIVGAAVAAVIVIYGRMRKKQRSETTEADYRAVDYTEVPPGEQTGAYRTYNQTGPKVDTLVVCPKCGANAYLDDNGCCQYCGAKVR